MIKLFKSPKKRLFSMIAMSFTVACTSTVYAEITERPKGDATYDEKVVLNSEWQIYPDEYVGANKRKYTFNKGLTISLDDSYAHSAIYLSGKTDVDFELGAGSTMNLETSRGALRVGPDSKLTINGEKSNLDFGNKTWDTYGVEDTIWLEEKSKLEIHADNLTAAGGAETNLSLCDNAQASIDLQGNFISDAGGTAIAMENDERGSDTRLSIQAANITLGTTDLETAKRKAGLYLLAYKEKGDNTLSVGLHAQDTLCISGFAKGIQTFGNAFIDLTGKTINISADSAAGGRGVSLNSYGAVKPSILKAEAENLNISGSDYAIYATDRANAQLNATGNIDISGANCAISADKNTDIQLHAAGNIDISGANYAIYSAQNTDTQLHADQNLQILSDTWGIVASGSSVNAQAEKEIDIKGRVWTSGGHITVGKDSADLKTVIEGDLTAKNQGHIAAYVNHMGSCFIGNTSDAHWKDFTSERDQGIHLMLNDGSIWRNWGGSDSTIQSIDTSNAVIDMHDGKYGRLSIGTLKGDHSIFHLDIDAGTNANNSDRIYISGTHTGSQYIALHNVNPEGKIDGAAGTVLVSVNDEQGHFLAKDKEGSLYWYKYALDKKESATDGYHTDWYLKAVEVIPAYPLTPANPRPTTSVEAVDATQRLSFANWVEDDKLMQRMGDLRHNSDKEDGIWARVKGGKYSGDGFSNHHTMYQIGYDALVKDTEEMKRYQGVAISYDDGKNSFHRGNGKLKAKSIGFYSTDLRDTGHYLDLACQIYGADSDFNVFDSTRKKITGTYENIGISFSAEYGRKKKLNEHWSMEPQAQLTLGHLSGADYTTSNGIRVSQSDPNSVLGRIGCNFMYDMDEKNTVYLKANWLHQFAGNYGVTLSSGDDSLRIDHHDHDTWFEYGLGFALRISKNRQLYADVEHSTGGRVRKDWQWNAGVSWSF